MDFAGTQVEAASHTLGGGQAEGHGGGRHQDVGEDGPVPRGRRRGALLQQVQHRPPDVPGDITTDVQQHRHVLFAAGERGGGRKTKTHTRPMKCSSSDDKRRGRWRTDSPDVGVLGRESRDFQSEHAGVFQSDEVGEDG